MPCNESLQKVERFNRLVLIRLEVENLGVEDLRGMYSLGIGPLILHIPYRIKV